MNYVDYFELYYIYILWGLSLDGMDWLWLGLNIFIEYLKLKII